MNSELDWEFIKAQLPAGWRELAVERGLIRKHLPQLHTKVTDIEQVLRPLLHRIGNGTSLQTATSTAAMARKAIAALAGDEAAEAAQLLDLSAPALHYWERKLGSYLAELNARMLNARDLFSPQRWGGYEVVLADGTTVTCPGATGITARVLYALRLADLTWLSCHETDQHGSESLRLFDIQPGQLWIADRFYCNPYDIAWTVDAGADPLVRFNFGALPLFDAQGQAFDVMDHVQALRQPHQMAEWAVEVHLSEHTPIRGRLCAVRLPEEEVKKAQERLRRESGSNVSPVSLQAAAWVILFTTAPAKRLTTNQVLNIYRLRWQVELEIRRDKSLGDLDELPNFREDTIATWIFGKLLLQQIARKVVSPRVAFPPSAVAFDLLPNAERDLRRPPSPQRTGRQRDVARHGPRLPVHPCRPAPRSAP